MKETVHSCELYEKVMENSVVPIVTDLSTAYQSENECHKMFSAPIMSTEVNKSFGTSEKQMTSLKFSRKKLKELAREKACTDSVGFNVVSFSEAAQNSLNSSSISNPKHKGTIRDQHVTGKHQNSAETSFKHSYNLQGCLQKTHNATKLDSILPVKRKRTKLKKMSHSEATSEFSPKCGRIAKGWKLLRLSDTVLKFTFTDAQSFMTKDTMLASEKMLSFKYKPELHGNHAIGSNSLTYSTKPSMQNNMGFLQPSTPKTLPNFSKYLENRDVNEAHLMVSNISDGHEKAKKRDRKKQDKVHSFKVTSSRVKHECVQMLEDSCYVAGTPVQSIAEEGALASRNLCLKNSIREPISVDYQCKRCFEVVAHSSSSFGALNALMDCVDEIIQKLKSLNISSCSEFVSSNIQNILVPYVGHGCMIVPYERNFDMLGKRRPRAKVDLDPESNRVWKLLMGKDDVVGDVQADLDKGSWWSEQRRVFQGRVDSFIARMRLVQGDRRFSQWKGSVVDSVVGVFLTQNVSDHLSSSAFMALISKFPLQPRGKFSEPNEEKVVLDENVDKKGTSNCAAALLSCSGSSVVDYSQENANLDEKVVILDHESCTTAYGTIVSAIENTSLGDMKNERDLKDVFPTQNFVVSSQNFMDCNVQSNNHISANSDGLLRGNLPTACSSSSFTELLQMAKCSSFQELFIHGNGTTSQEAYLSTKNCFTALNKFGNSGGTCPSVKAYSNLHLRLFCSSTISPSKSCLCDDICNSKFRENNANLMTDKTIHCSPSTRCEIKSCNECKNCSESEGSLTELSSLHEMASSIIDFPLTKSKQHTKSITLFRHGSKC
ncbi:hypothetical protein HPP92_016165 [Vanilla planifolia]|uniref:Protein ROS1 n=1 Tax=Vanilla planifolia TaxID=51239 RepID=A0A835UR01_VANPL|nr:hypothetical protein HPP92_016165 [Vanilla planifolia]